MQKLYVSYRETGRFIEEVRSFEEGLELIKFYEDDDKKDGTYKKYHYDIVNEERRSLLYE